ncbi:kinase-like protein [Auricularia subglabra TFB-10046 SS5]|nr:kinase-like protein [Auricularia subglabra TFB-10046 SS5]
MPLSVYGTTVMTPAQRYEAMARRENQILSSLYHPNIITCPRISEVDGKKYVVTEWAENGTLRVYLDKYPQTDRLWLLLGVACALHYLHTRQNPIIHGDLYIDNVLVASGGLAKLSDFGMSTIVSPDDPNLPTLPGGPADYLLARAAYEAPERHGDPHAPRSFATDVFAFGMLVFHVYAGRRPFADLPNDAAVIVEIFKGQRPERSEITRGDFPDALWELIQECWSQNPEDRPRMRDVRSRLYAIWGDHLHLRWLRKVHGEMPNGC